MHGKKWCRYREREGGTALLTPIGFLSSLLPFFSQYPYYFPLDTTYSSVLMMEAAGFSKTLITRLCDVIM
jgi:hypothetical protein